MSKCNNCHDAGFIDVRLPYKALHEMVMATYHPLWISCPTCAHDYKCEKCGSKNTELLFSKIALDKYANRTVIKCNDCDKGDKNE